jgi:hypothetical protein
MAKATKNTNTIVNTAEQGLLIQNLDIRPVQRSSADIAKWRSALQTAESTSGTRVPLYDLYSDILLDGFLKRMISQRILGVTKTRLQFVGKDGKENEQIADLIKKQQFRKLRKAIQKQKAWGHTVIELSKKNEEFHFYEVPPKHIRPKEGLITNTQYDVTGDKYREPPYSKFVFEVGDSEDFGYILEACQYVIYKRGGFGDWANFAQLFGMPFREARYDGYNGQVRKQLETALKSMGSAGYAILPKEAELKLHEAKNAAGSNELYNSLRKSCNEEIAILVLGQTETTSKTAGKLGGNDDTHEQTEDDINQDDRLDELAILNEKVVPILKNLGYPVDGGQFIHEPNKEDLSIKDMIGVVDTAVNKLDLPVDDDFIYELTGIPKPKNYDALKAEKAASKELAQQQQQKGKNEAQEEPPSDKQLSAEAVAKIVRETMKGFF